MLNDDFGQACYWLHTHGWTVTADGNRGYYLNNECINSWAYCTNKGAVVDFAETYGIKDIFTKRNNLYAEDLLVGEGEKQVASESRTDKQA